MSRFQFVICAKRDVQVMVDGLQATHVLSLLDPGVEMVTPVGIDPSRHLVLHCEDTEDADWEAGPSVDQVARILEFGRDLPNGAVLVVHCHAGVSRSPAALLAILVQEGRSSAEDCRRAARMVRKARDQASPNRLIAWHADQLLGCGGALLAEAERISAWQYRVQFGGTLRPFDAPAVQAVVP